MSFYRQISDYYDEIFPLNPGQVHFVRYHLKDLRSADILDVGCGTGGLAVALADSSTRVVGIDLDKAMVEQAMMKSEKETNPEFISMDMLEIASAFGKESFNAIICFGNTLVHLPGPEEITRFILACSVALREDGRLLIQIINYDRILDDQVGNLATIRSNGIRFVRNYTYDPDRHRIEFETILTADALEGEVRNTIELYPLRKQELVSLLEQCGFTITGFYGNFVMEPHKPESVPLIVTAVKRSERP